MVKKDKIKLITADKVSTPYGCWGSKKTECKYLLPIILPHINDDITFVEPFCGSSVVSYNIYKYKNNANFHINDIDKIRTDFYINMRDEKNRQDLYKLEQLILKEGQDKYYEIVRTKKTDYESLYYKEILSQRIHSFRSGLWPTTKKIILHEISNDWINFFNKSNITNFDFKQIFKNYEDNEKIFLYLDPPYSNSYNASYSNYNNKHDENLNIIDNTQIYLDLLFFLKNAKCKILFSINMNALTIYLYQDYIKYIYTQVYQNTHKNIENTKATKKKEQVLIISNFEINEIDNFKGIEKFNLNQNVF